MANLSGIPTWVQVSKQKVLRSDEWLAFSKVLFDEVSKHLRDNGVRTFSSLSAEEQNILILDAVELLKSDPQYTDLLKVVSSNLDKELGNQADNYKASKAQELTRLDYIARECDNAVEILLDKWPEMKTHMQQCHGVQISRKMRYVLWKNQLQHNKAKDEYKQAVGSGLKQRLVSPLDFEISQKSQALLKSDHTLAPLLNFKEATSVLRHLLSYHHLRSKSTVGLTDTDYLLAVPFVYCTLGSHLDKIDSTTSPKQVLTTESLAVMTSQHEVFLKRRPDYMTAQDNVRSFVNFCAEAKRIITNNEPRLLNQLETLFTRHANKSSGNCIGVLFRPCLRSLLVGYLPLEALMYVWDHVILGFDVERYDPVASFCASFLLIAREKIMDCGTWKQLDAAVKGSMRVLTAEKIRGAMIEHKLNHKLVNILKSERENRRQFPIAEMTPSLPPWRDWFSVKLQKFLKSEQMQQQKSKTRSPLLEEGGGGSGGSTPLLDNVEELKSERDQLVDELQLMRDELIKTRKLLTEERLAKSELQDAADEQIERLRRRLEPEKLPAPFKAAELYLTEPEYSESETNSVTSPSKPPSPVTVKTPPLKVETPKSDGGSEVQVDGAPAERNETPQEEPGKQEEREALDVVRDVVARIMKAANAIAHGSDEDLLAINDQTSADMKRIRAAFEQANVDVFKRPMGDDEIANLPPKERQQAEVALEAATKKRLLQLKLI